MSHTTSPNCTVLVVDDEQVVRHAVGGLLRILGYNVIFACSAEEALSLLSDQTVDIVLTDVTMPSMSGIELGAELARQRPAVPVIYMSGCANENALPRQGGRHPARFLPKPFRLAALQATVGAAAAAVCGR